MKHKAEEKNKSQETNNQKKPNYEEETTESGEGKLIPGKKKKGGPIKNLTQGKTRKFNTPSIEKERNRLGKKTEQTLEPMRRKKKRRRNNKGVEEVEKTPF